MGGPEKPATSESAPETSEHGPLNLLVARNLRRYRQTTGLSQERLAEELGFHRTYWSALEQGKKNPSLRTLERLADRLGIQALDLFKD